MHEIGMLYQTAKLATEYAEKNALDQIGFISIDIGELSGALPKVFEDYFPYVAEQFPKVQSADLRLRVIPGEAMCDECKCMYNVMKQEGICPRCGCGDKTIISGREVRLRNIGC